MKSMRRIIVDGYNLLGSRRGLRGNLTGRREKLVGELSKYSKKTGADIILVFDGWRGGSRAGSVNREGEISIVFSPRREKADSVIVRMVRESDIPCTVVTSDRELRNKVREAGGEVMFVKEFERMLGRD